MATSAAPTPEALVADLVLLLDLEPRGNDRFVGRRKKGDDPEKGPEQGAPWQMPQGGIDKGESPLEAARRELYEETSITSIELIAEAPDWVFYDLPDELLGSALKEAADGV